VDAGKLVPRTCTVLYKWSASTKNYKPCKETGKCNLYLREKMQAKKHSLLEEPDVTLNKDFKGAIINVLKN
jgi:hypothetical protein